MPLQYQPTARLHHSEGHQDGVTTVEFSPNGLLLASGGLDGRVCIWDSCSSKLQYVFSGKSAVLSVRWLEQSSEHLVCGMEDGTIAFLTFSRDLIQLTGFLSHRYPVERLAINGTTLASGAHREVKIWSCMPDGSWKQTKNLDPPPQSSYTNGCEIIVTSLHWTSAPRRPSVLLITYMSHGIVAYDARTWKRIRATPFPGRIADSSLTRDGRLLAVSNMLTGFELFLMKAPAEVEPLFSFQQDVGAGRPLPVRFLHGDNAIVGGTSHGQINIWDVRTRLKQSLHVGAGSSVLAVAAHYDLNTDNFLIATGTFVNGGSSPVIVWQAKEACDRRRLIGKLDIVLDSSTRIRCSALCALLKWALLLLVLGISLKIF